MSNFIFKSINGISTPKPVGPYCSAVQVNNTLYLSGMIGIDPKTEKLVNGGVISEIEQVFKNIEALLQETGSCFKNVVSVKIYLIDISNSATVNEIYQKYFKPPFPARCLLEVNRLPLDAKIEVEVMALITDTCRL